MKVKISPPREAGLECHVECAVWWTGEVLFSLELRVYVHSPKSESHTEVRLSDCSLRGEEN